jgi:hypothetical protein
VPYYEYEAEDATTNGTVIAPSRTFGDVAAEASGRRAVRLDSAGQYVRFTVIHPANSIVVRYSVPDAPAGGGAETTIGVLVDGARKTSLSLTSRYSYTYGDADAQGQGSEAPSAGTAHHFFDEAHALVGEISAGSTVALQRDAQDTASTYVIDLVDLEEVPAPLGAPPGALSITDYGAVAGDANDDGPAIQKAIDAAASQGKTLWIPPGRFVSDTSPLRISGITIRGAGMWYSALEGRFARFKVGGHIEVHDVSVFGDVTYRDDQADDSAFDGPAGVGSLLENVWIEHVKAGYWVGRGAQPPPITTALTDGLVIRGARIRDTYADGVNFANGTKNSVVEQSTFRNTGDDALATWSFASDGPAPCENDAFRFNTVQAVWRANCIALYGGKNNLVQDNVCADTADYPGVLVSTTFGALPFDGTTLVQRNTIVRGGGPHYGQEFAALRFFADQAPVSGIQVEDVLIDAPTFSGIQFSGSQLVSGVTLNRITIRDYTTNGIWITSEAHGSTSASDVGVSGPPGSGLKNDASDTFTIERGAGNSGW